ncbi:hypothetical protein [Paenibacillus sp. FSL H3-0333]|uniref:hypothetical protein n=1 Tax=Paenibacillus sp. FSL H3-0333 TaxID=2921373 RepID=UPI0030FC19F6
MNIVLDSSYTEVFTIDGYGGITMLELDWEQDAIFERGNLEDRYGSIEEYFIKKEYPWYSSLSDCAYDIDPFTHLQLKSKGN